MKNIAISAPYHFSNQVTFFETLDSIISKDENVRLTSSAVSSICSLIRDYVDKYYFDYHFYIADWAKEINADLERDKRMIADADEIILFDDGCTNKIKLLKIWAIEKNMPVHIIEIVPIDTVKYTEIISKDLAQFQEKNEIAAAIEQFETAKEHAIKDGQYEVASLIRDKIRILSLR
jgi:hypothetical protein